MTYTKAQYKRAFEIACDLLNGANLYGIDTDFIFDFMMEKDDMVFNFSYREFILKHLDRFDDNGEVRTKAVERLGW